MLICCLTYNSLFSLQSQFLKATSRLQSLGFLWILWPLTRPDGCSSFNSYDHFPLALSPLDKSTVLTPVFSGLCSHSIQSRRPWPISSAGTMFSKRFVFYCGFNSHPKNIACMFHSGSQGPSLRPLALRDYQLSFLKSSHIQHPKLYHLLAKRYFSLPQLLIVNLRGIWV